MKKTKKNESGRNPSLLLYVDLLHSAAGSQQPLPLKGVDKTAVRVNLGPGPDSAAATAAAVVVAPARFETASAELETPAIVIIVVVVEVVAAAVAIVGCERPTNRSIVQVGLTGRTLHGGQYRHDYISHKRALDPSLTLLACHTTAFYPHLHGLRPPPLPSTLTRSAMLVAETAIAHITSHMVACRRRL